GAQAMLAASSQLTQRAIERLQETATQGREKWIYVGLATVGIAIALAILFATLIARPIRQLDLAIRQMGSADFTHGISVTSVNGSNGCAAACRSSKSSRRDSCDMCRTSSRRRLLPFARARSCCA